MQTSAVTVRPVAGARWRTGKSATSCGHGLSRCCRSWSDGRDIRARRRLDDRACLNGILFVLVTRMRWDRLPSQLGYGSGVMCWRRLRDWTTAGVWDRLHELLLAELHAAGRIDWSRAWSAPGPGLVRRRGRWLP